MNTPFSLASNQRDVWYDQAAYHNSPVYNIGGYFCFDDEIDCKLLEKAIHQLFLENDALRLFFLEQDGQLLQYINDVTDFTLEFVDFSENDKQIAHQWLE